MTEQKANQSMVSWSRNKLIEHIKKLEAGTKATQPKTPKSKESTREVLGKTGEVIQGCIAQVFELQNKNRCIEFTVIVSLLKSALSWLEIAKKKEF